MDQYGHPRRSPTLKRPAFDDHYASSSNTGRVGNGGASGSATPQPDIGSVASGDKQYDEGEDGSEPGAGGGSGGGGGQGGKRSRASGGGAAPPPLKRGSACSLCRKRKLVSLYSLFPVRRRADSNFEQRCDGVRPRCGTCLRLNHECQYGGMSSFSPYRSPSRLTTSFSQIRRRRRCRKSSESWKNDAVRLSLLHDFLRADTLVRPQVLSKPSLKPTAVMALPLPHRQLPLLPHPLLRYRRRTPTLLPASSHRRPFL